LDLRPGTESQFESEFEYENDEAIRVDTTKAAISVQIVNRQGLHARPAAQFVRAAGQFPECEVTVNRDGMVVNGKSIMGMMMLTAGPGSTLDIAADGEGAEELCQKLKELVEGGFGEDLVVEPA